MAGRTLSVDGSTYVEDEPVEVGGEAEERMLEAARGIIGSLSRTVHEQCRLKTGIEERWLEDLRHFYGRYDSDQEKDLEEDERSQAFVKITRNKTNGWAARLSDLLLPTDERNWDVLPTPLPKLAQAAKDAQKAAAEGANAANQEPDPNQAAMIAEQADAFAVAAHQTEQEIEDAKRRSTLMRDAIEDQLIESDYNAQLRDIIEDGCRLGTGILKGPMTSDRLRREWREEGGFYQLVEMPDPMPEFRRVDPWHFFPDMSARTIAEAEFTFERSLPTKRDLRRLALKLNFNKNAVRRLLTQGPPITGPDVDYISKLREITGEGEAIKDRYVMWEYHGPLECEDVASLLRAAGRTAEAEALKDNEDPLKEYRVIVHFCDQEVLKIAPEYPLDSGDSLYSVWNFEKGETSMFGIGIPHVMNDSQSAINGAWRMMMDNSGLSVGPQVVIDKDSIEPQDGTYGLRPLKVWLWSSTSLSDPQRPPFQVFNVPNNQQQLAGIIELAKQFIDEETSLPLISQGEPGAVAQTLGGMSILSNAANVVFRRVVKSFDDDMTKPTIRRAYDWNMQFHPNNEIKGDMQVDARGSSVLLVREIQSQNLFNIMTGWTTHQVIGPYMKVRPGLTKALQTMMIPADELLYTEDEVGRRQQEAAAAAAAQGEGTPDARLQAAMLEQQTRLEVAGLEREIKLMDIAARENVSVQALQAKLQLAKIQTDSKERLHAVNVAIEGQRAAAAERRGTPPQAAVGVGVG